MDDGLVERCICNDSEAWRALIARHRPMVLRLLLRMVGRRDPAVVLDLEQDLWARLLANDRVVLRSLVGRSSDARTALIATIALNLARDHGRKVAVREAVRPDQLTNLAGRENEGPEAEASSAERRRLALDAAALVVSSQEETRDLLIFRCYYTDGLTAAEISTMGVGLSVKGVETVICRLTAKVRAHLTGAIDAA